MKKADRDEILPEYDFREGVRGKYVERVQRSNVVVLDPDVAAAFPTSAAVNKALRKQLKAAKTRKAG
jgi:hypothetical protein